MLDRVLNVTKLNILCTVLVKNRIYSYHHPSC